MSFPCVDEVPVNSGVTWGFQRAAESPCQVPQQWIGSSVALAAEVGSFSTEPKVLVKVFDWGRAELNTQEDFQRLQAAERESRCYYWRWGENMGWTDGPWEFCKGLCMCGGFTPAIHPSMLISLFWQGVEPQAILAGPGTALLGAGSSGAASMLQQ